MGPPKVKSRHMKALLASVDRRPEAPAVRARLDEGVVRAIEDSRGVEWQPLEWNLGLTRAVRAELGAAATHTFFREMLLESFRGPLLGLLVDSAVRVFGIDPASWARWVPRGWALVFQDCGRWSVDAQNRRVTFRCEDLPGDCVEDDVWVRSVASSLGALVDLARARGGVELLEMDRAARRATFLMEWE